MASSIQNNLVHVTQPVAEPSTPEQEESSTTAKVAEVAQNSALVPDPRAFERAEAAVAEKENVFTPPRAVNRRYTSPQKVVFMDGSDAVCAFVSSAASPSKPNFSVPAKKVRSPMPYHNASSFNNPSKVVRKCLKRAKKDDGVVTVVPKSAEKSFKAIRRAIKGDVKKPHFKVESEVLGKRGSKRIRYYSVHNTNLYRAYPEEGGDRTVTFRGRSLFQAHADFIAASKKRCFEKYLFQDDPSPPKKQK